jgi:methylated-DNA-protein-cysteine methyltransferase-like protein
MYERIYHAVYRIPAGCVATYGQIAALAGFPRRARQVGYALAAGGPEDLPWHRVVNAKGEISRRADPAGHEDLQRRLLESEGVEFSTRGNISLQRFRWRPQLDED